MIHFPILLLSVLPMLKNIKALYQQLQHPQQPDQFKPHPKSQKRRASLEGAKQRRRSTEDQNTKHRAPQLRCHFERLLVSLVAPRPAGGDAHLSGAGAMPQTGAFRPLLDSRRDRC